MFENVSIKDSLICFQHNHTTIYPNIKYQIIFKLSGLSYKCILQFGQIRAQKYPYITTGSYVS